MCNQIIKQDELNLKMLNKNVVYIQVNTAKDSILEKSIDAYLQNLTVLRKKRKSAYEKKVEKQIKKIERSRL